MSFNILYIIFIFALTATSSFSQNGKVTYLNGNEIKNEVEGVKETKLESVEFLSTDSELKEATTIEDIKLLVDKTNTIFIDLFKESKKAEKVMVEFELLKKKPNKISFAVQDDLDLDLMKLFEERVLTEYYPKSKTKPIKLRLIFNVNSFNN